MNVPCPEGSSASSVRQKKSFITQVALSVCDRDRAKVTITSAGHTDGAWMGLKLAVILRPRELVCKRTDEGSGG